MAKPLSKAEGNNAADLNSYHGGSRLRRQLTKLMKRHVSKLRRLAGKKELPMESE